jgi:hypothetical protein
MRAHPKRLARCERVNPPSTPNNSSQNRFSPCAPPFQPTHSREKLPDDLRVVDAFILAAGVLSDRLMPGTELGRRRRRRVLHLGRRHRVGGVSPTHPRLDLRIHG